jgi:hypothetical protein
VEVNPRFAARLAALGLTTAEVLLDLPGEVVCGHPDRHVVRVEMPESPSALYLKRQHRVGWRERLRQWRAGFGWASKCEREAHLLRQLERDGFACPEWVAYGEDGAGRAFLLVEELADAVELRRLLADSALSPDDRTRLAERLGQTVAELHAGFDTPDLTAKHVFVNPRSFAITLIDWQSARRTDRLGLRERLRAVAALDASLGDQLVSRRDRFRTLWAYLRVARRQGFRPPRFSVVARQVARLAAKAALRRSIRDQRQPVVTGSAEQRLVWLAGEAVCAVPDVAAVWPRPAIAPPYYEWAAASDPSPRRVHLPNGTPAELVRFTTFDPLGRVVAAARGRPWRSPGATLGRVLFHLQHYGIPAPRLLAFGQRLTGRMTAESFALYEPPAGVPLEDWLTQPQPPVLRRVVLRQAGFLLRQLHDAGCRPSRSATLFSVCADPARVTVVGVGAIRLLRRVSQRMRRADLRGIARALRLSDRADRLCVIRGYLGERPAHLPELMERHE